MGCTLPFKKQKDKIEKNLNLQNFPSICEQGYSDFHSQAIEFSSWSEQKLAELGYSRFCCHQIRNKKFGQRQYKEGIGYTITKRKS